MNDLSVVMVGEVDHGKSSLIGRLLFETKAVAPSRLEMVQKICADQGKDFELAFLLDAFEEEQRQGITIDVSHFQFTSSKRAYHLIDAPGHREFLKNMVSGSSQADAAVLLVDAKEGMREQSRRHCYLLKLLGIKNVVVAINKMDLIRYDELEFTRIRDEHMNYMRELGLEITAARYIPLSAKIGDNVTKLSAAMSWYTGDTFLEALDKLPNAIATTQAPLRFSVQDVYKFDERRIVAGRVESGAIAVGAKIQIWPSGETATVKSIARWQAPVRETASAGESIGLVLSEQRFIERGHVLTAVSAPPMVAQTFEASIFWMGRQTLTLHTPLKIKILSQEIEARVERIFRTVDTTTLKAQAETPQSIGRHEVAEVALRLAQPIVIDRFSDVAASGRFVLVSCVDGDSGEISGGGIITSAAKPSLRARPQSQNIAWQFDYVTLAERELRQHHRSAVLWLTGLSGAGKSTLAKWLERELFRRGCQTVVLDGDNLRHGLNGDLDFSAESRRENIRRVGETAKLFADAGHIVIAALITPFEEDRKRVREISGGQSHFEIYVRCSLQECERRDAKGLYKKARGGQVSNFTGISSPFEEPKQSDFIVDTEQQSPEVAGASVIALLEREGIFTSPTAGVRPTGVSVLASATLC